MRKWEFKLQELIPTPIDARQYEENLAEIAELLYIHFKKLKVQPISVSPLGDTRKYHDRGHQKGVRS